MENNNDVVTITEAIKVISVKRAMIDHSTFEDVSAKNLRITDANLSDLEIEGAQLGGAYIHNIGMPPAGHPFYDPAARQRPLKFEDCDLNCSTIINCNLGDVSIDNCNIKGMTVNGVLVEDLLKNYQK